MGRGEAWNKSVSILAKGYDRARRHAEGQRQKMTEDMLTGTKREGLVKEGLRDPRV